MVDDTIISIYKDGQKLVEIHLSYHSGYKPEIAAVAFWDAVAQFNPYLTELNDLRARLAKYESVDSIEPEDPIKAYNRAMKVVG